MMSQFVRHLALVLSFSIAQCILTSCGHETVPGDGDSHGHPAAIIGGQGNVDLVSGEHQSGARPLGGSSAARDTGGQERPSPCLLPACVEEHGRTHVCDQNDYEIDQENSLCCADNCTSGNGEDVDEGIRTAKTLMASALAWGSTLHQTTVDESGAGSIVGTGNLTVTPSSTDPDGAPTVFTLSENDATSQHFVDWAPPTTLQIGAMYELEWNYKTEKSTVDRNSTVAAVGYASGPFVYIVHQAPRISRISGPEIHRGEVRDIDGEWLRVRIWFTAEETQILRLYVSGTAPYTGSNTNVGHMTIPSWKRVSVSAQKNLTGGPAIISQTIAAKRPKVDPTGWQLTTPAMHFDADTGHLDITDVPAAMSGTSRSWTFSMLLQPRKHWQSQATPLAPQSYFLATGHTASLEIKQTDKGIQVLRRDDAANESVATLPISTLHDVSQILHIVCDGKNVQLYVQGVALGSPQPLTGGAATFTASRVGGGAIALVAEWALWDSELASDQVSLTASYLASTREMSTDPIPFFIGVSQSNGGERGSMSDISLEDQFPPRLGASIYRHKQNGIRTENTDWGPIRIRNSIVATGLTYADNVGSFGWERSFARIYGRCAIAKYVVGGTSLKEFINGGSYWTEQVLELEDAIEDLASGGMPYTVEALVNVHGEADVNNALSVASFTTWMETLRSDLEGTLGITIPLLVEPRLHQNIAGAHLQDLRRNLALWETANPATRALIDIDDLDLGSDGVHWSTPMILVGGARMATLSNRVKDVVE